MKKVFAGVGYAHNVDLYHEFGEVSSPLEVYSSLEDYDRAYPVETRDEYDFPVKITFTYEVETVDTADHDAESVLALLEAPDEGDVLKPLRGD